MSKQMTTNETLPSGRAKLVPIDPANLTVQSGGHGWQYYNLRLPAGVIADDLKSTGHELWKRIQGATSKSLKRHDRIYFISHDESWSADAIVADASPSEVSLTGFKIYEMQSRLKSYFQDDTYAVVWLGNGFAVKRKVDGAIVSEIVANEALAERDLRRQYPKVA